eukprot:Lithocolla_globosa_v1_NODE_1315_length_2677_cov_13.200229.p2 type:complete len:166 gc:universal NODE_1315_length_2677_cov_13.200229:1635-1138(-)
MFSGLLRLHKKSPLLSSSLAFPTSLSLFGSNLILRHYSSSSQSSPPANTVRVEFHTPEDGVIVLDAPKGTNILELAHDNKIDLEGACEGSLACSTCHVILEEKLYSQLEEPSDEENDMLDLAFGLTDTSRLGCQVEISDLFEGTKITIPSATRNMAVDGYKPQPH